jgi:hypothetical protein
VGFHSDDNIVSDWDCARIDAARQAMGGTSRCPEHERSMLGPDAHLQLHEPQDDVTVALAGDAQRSESVDDGGLKPDIRSALGVELDLVANAAERYLPYGF